MPESVEPTPVPARPTAPLWQIVSALGVAQIISWGSLYYSLAVIASSIKAELGFSEVMIFGAFTVGQLVSGVSAPWVGGRIDRFGGRGVLTAGSLLAAAALTMIGLAQSFFLFLVGWIIAGLATAACLYDAAFATLHRVAGDQYRPAVTGLTLFGGFASTVFWPLTHELASTADWRVALLTFAGLHLFVCLPIHRYSVPAIRQKSTVHTSSVTHGAPVRDVRFAWLAASFAGITFIFSALSAHMITALGTRGFSAEQAVWIGALVGPMQVLARIVEWFFAGRVSAIRVGYVACALNVLAMLLLNAAPPLIAFAAAFALCYGASNGILTIARGTVPVELFGQSRIGALLGSLARPSFIAKAFAPVIFAIGVSAGVAMEVGTMMLAAVSTVALICFWQAVRPRRNGVDAPARAEVRLEQPSETNRRP